MTDEIKISEAAKEVALRIVVQAQDQQGWRDVRDWNKLSIPQNLYGVAVEIQRYANERVKEMAELSIANKQKVIERDQRIAELEAALREVAAHRKEDKDGNYVMWIGEGTFLRVQQALGEKTV